MFNCVIYLLNEYVLGELGITFLWLDVGHTCYLPEDVREFVRFFQEITGLAAAGAVLGELSLRHKRQAATTERGPPIPGQPHLP